jgi:hypothetical protein
VFGVRCEFEAMRGKLVRVQPKRRT